MTGTIVFWAFIAAFVAIPVVGLVMAMGARKRRTPRTGPRRPHKHHRQGR